jgi:hypothetical protein
MDGGEEETQEEVAVQKGFSMIQDKNMKRLMSLDKNQKFFSTRTRHEIDLSLMCSLLGKRAGEEITKFFDKTKKNDEGKIKNSFQNSSLSSSAHIINKLTRWVQGTQAIGG